MWALDNGYEMIVIDKDNPTLGKSCHSHFPTITTVCMQYISYIYIYIYIYILCAMYVLYILYDTLRLARP